MATLTPELYEQDFYVWTQRQAEALRRLAETRPNVDLDFPHLIEEVEDLGTSQRDAVRSQARRIIEHSLRLEYSRAVDRAAAGMIRSSMPARNSTTSSARRCVATSMSSSHASGCRLGPKPTTAYARFGEPDAADLLQADCPYLFDDLLADGWYPANRRGVPDDR